MKKIFVSDITLRELAKSRETALLFREKTAIASSAAALGADSVELPPIKNAREDSIIYKTIAGSIRDAVVAIPVGATVEEVKNAWECVKDAAKARLQVALPVATATMEYTYHIKAANMAAKITELVSAAKELCDDARNITLNYLKELGGDVRHFCDMFDYRNNGEDADWGNSKDAIERTVAFLDGELPPHIKIK